MRAFAVIGLWSALACQPRQQWLVQLDSDARVPQFGDRLLIEILDPEGRLACPGCRRQLAAGSPERWPVSFGIPADLDLPEGARVRARLYRSDHAGPDGVADPVYLDRSGRLPPAGAFVTRVRLSLPMDCFFVSAEPGRTCDPATGQLGPEPTLGLIEEGAALLRPDTWAPATETRCALPPPAGMVCVPGGVFVLGDPRGLPAGGAFRGLPEHLVQLPPFYLDQDEFTLGQTKSPPMGGIGPNICTGSLVPSDPEMPVSCVWHTWADEACKALGKRLPTEAEWEYAAGNLSKESTYPWGEDPEVCARAIVGGDLTGGCPPREKNGPLPINGQAGGDVTALGIRGMGGNLSELVDGKFADYAAPCWTAFQGKGKLLRDPTCQTGPSGVEPIRGGSWNTSGDEIRGATRNSVNNPSKNLYNTVGFRCAMDVESLPGTRLGARVRTMLAAEDAVAEPE